MNQLERKEELTDFEFLHDWHMWNIRDHYHHARDKHPYFADHLYHNDQRIADMALKQERDIIAASAKRHSLSANDVLRCEILEANEALSKGDKCAAIGEMYDAIAVLLRMIDALRGFQELGDPDDERKQTCRWHDGNMDCCRHPSTYEKMKKWGVFAEFKCALCDGCGYEKEDKNHPRWDEE